MSNQAAEHFRKQNKKDLQEESERLRNLKCQGFTENNQTMNKDPKACTGIPLSKSGKATGKCPLKGTCERFALHQKNNLNQVYLPVPHEAITEGICSFKMEL